MNHLKTKNAFFLFILELLCLIKVSRGIGNYSDLLPKNYESGKPPISNGEPVKVYFKLFVQTVAPIISSEMEYRINIRLTMTWVDHRLILNPERFDSEDCYDFIILSPDVSSKMWHPDPFIVNSKYSEIKQFSTKLVNTYVFENYTVQYTMILNATLACAMNFRFYPLDIQLCPMYIQSFSYDDLLVQFKWESVDPFVVTPRTLIQFVVVTPPPPEEELDIQREKNFSRLVGTFRFERLIGSHLVQSFIPCSLVVTLSWFSFWLELDGIAARGSFLVICILTLVTHFSGLKLELPPVAYVKAVDIWMFGSTVWVFAALFEFILVKVLYTIALEVRRENQVYSMRKTVGDEDLFLRVLNSSPRDNSRQNVVTPYTAFWLWDELRLAVPAAEITPPLEACRDKCYYKKKRLGSYVLSGRSTATTNLPVVNKPIWRFNLPLIWETDKKTLLWIEIDRVSKWLFPLSFIIFCSVYWSVLLIHAILT